eukprot:12429452-Karenia_brevis.AAC.1
MVCAFGAAMRVLTSRWREIGRKCAWEGKYLPLQKAPNTAMPRLQDAQLMLAAQVGKLQAKGMKVQGIKARATQPGPSRNPNDTSGAPGMIQEPMETLDSSKDLRGARKSPQETFGRSRAPGATKGPGSPEEPPRATRNLQEPWGSPQESLTATSSPQVFEKPPGAIGKLSGTYRSLQEPAKALRRPPEARNLEEFTGGRKETPGATRAKPKPEISFQNGIQNHK